jgi:hypothetical protein
MDMNHALRAELDKISDGENHAAGVERLKQDFKHSITCIGPGKKNQRCLSYAMGIEEDFIRDSGPIFEDFLMWYCLKNEDSNGDLVIYFQNKRPKHGGIGRERITSKWGPNPVYQHNLWEVPASYGDVCLRCRLPSPEEAVHDFKNYLPYHGRFPDYKDLLKPWVE